MGAGLLAILVAVSLFRLTGKILGVDEESAQSNSAHSWIEPLVGFLLETILLCACVPFWFYECCYCRVRCHAATNLDIAHCKYQELPAPEDEYTPQYGECCPCCCPESERPIFSSVEARVAAVKERQAASSGPGSHTEVQGRAGGSTGVVEQVEVQGQ